MKKTFYQSSDIVKHCKAFYSLLIAMSFNLADFKER